MKRYLLYLLSLLLLLSLAACGLQPETVPETTADITTKDITASGTTVADTSEKDTIPSGTAEDITTEDTTPPETAEDITTEDTIPPETTENITTEDTTPPETTEPADTSCPHEYKTTTTEATCTTAGKTVTTCSRCSFSKTEIIPAKGHDTKTTTTEATCTATGKTVTTCSRCSFSQTETIPAKGHDTKTTTTEATCTTTGKTVTTCSRCSFSQTETIPAKGHDTKTTTTEATCTATGKTVTTCSRCSFSQTETIPAKGHDTKTTTTEATCTTAGKTVTTCSRCSFSKTETIPAKGHHYQTTTVKATCETNGSKTTACSRCSSRTVEILPATGHHYSSYTVKVAPTPTVAGILTYTCDVCKGTYDKNIGVLNFDPSLYGSPTRIITSNNPNNCVEFRITDDTLTIQGRIQRDGLTKLWLRCEIPSNLEDEFVSVTSGEFFYTELSLSRVTEETYVSIFTQVNGESNFWSYIWHEISVMPSEDGYVFRLSPVLSHNLSLQRQWVDPSECLSLTISDTIRNLSNEIVGDETDTYRKLYLLNKWVAENIYYDYDYLYGRSDSLSLSALEVYETRRSVCDGYATLLGNLIQAQGIPCIRVSTYSTGSGTIDENNAQTTESNHVHIEAYLAEENRWVIMDPTWDSGNRYENGEYLTENASAKWFDISPDLMAFTHKIIDRPYPFFW
ncbi:MAG: transglutaminase domain-containing protein [Ruminococcaceae bacterium]|nr:transglutaminase domain-containing protein [Oscillospiraceae bacterium]